jgi:hypothetical protein
MNERERKSVCAFSPSLRVYISRRESAALLWGNVIRHARSLVSRFVLSQRRGYERETTMKRARAYYCEEFDWKRERERSISSFQWYLLFLSPPLCDQRCVRDYNYKEPHKQVWADSSRHLFTDEFTHLSCASVHVREGLWKSSSMYRYECVHVIEYVWLLKKRRFSQTSQKFRERVLNHLQPPWTYLSRLRILRTTICSFEQRTQTVRLKAFKEAFVLLSSRFSLPSSSSSWNGIWTKSFCVPWWIRTRYR